MKSKYSALLGCAALIMTGILIFDTKTAYAGAMDGIQLCLQSVIPALFPFIFLSILITSGLCGANIPILRPLGKLFLLPPGAEYLLLMAFLGGYPVGAQSIHSAWQDEVLDTKTAKRLLGFCNNAGPSFIFGIVGPMFSGMSTAWSLWIIHIISALIVCRLLPVNKGAVQIKTYTKSVSLTASIPHALKVLSGICGWVIIFRVLLKFLTQYFIGQTPATVQVLFSGVMELTNGCLLLQCIYYEPLRYVIASVLIGFGGLCVYLQTRSVTGELGLGYYFPGKLLQSSISLLLAILSIPLLYKIENLSCYLRCLCISGLSVILLIIIFKKGVAIRKKLLYNHFSS